MDWRSKAACLTTDPELFFPLSDYGPSLAQTRIAVGHCLDCEVREACLKWALDNDIHHGIWGGATEEQRRDLFVQKMDQDLPAVRQVGRSVRPPFKSVQPA